LIVPGATDGSTNIYPTVVAVGVNDAPPGQTIPNPHNIPNSAKTAPNINKGNQHNGPHNPFFKGGSCYIIILV
jgi:hypothetical protein